MYLLEHWTSYLCIDVGDLFVYRIDSVPFIIIIVWSLNHIELRMKNVIERFKLLKWLFNSILKDFVCVLSRTYWPNQYPLFWFYVPEFNCRWLNTAEWLGHTKKTVRERMHDSCAYYCWNCVWAQTPLICELFPKSENGKCACMCFVSQLFLFCALIAFFLYSLAAWLVQMVER